MKWQRTAPIVVMLVVLLTACGRGNATSPAESTAPHGAEVPSDATALPPNTEGIPAPPAEDLLAGVEVPAPETGGVTPGQAPAPEAALPPPPPASNVVDALSSSRFTTLAELLQETRLAETLSAGGPFTLFAPTNEAFAALPPGVLDALKQDPYTLAEILSYHIVNGELYRRDLEGIGHIETYQGGVIDADLSGSSLLLNDAAQAKVPGIRTTNGVVYTLDAVLVPEDVALPVVR